MMARRFVVGSGQLLLALAGFVLVTGWFVMNMIRLYDQFEGEPQPKSFAWLGQWGALIFSAAWLWSLVTSLNLVRQAKTLEPAGQQNVPPRIDEVADDTLEQ